MASLMDTIMGQLGGDALKQIAGQLGTDEKTTGVATGAALTTLLGAISRNSTKPGGADALHNALSKDHDGSIMDNLGSFLGGGDQASAGTDILRHVLGDKQPNVERSLGKASGIDQASMGKLLAVLAPIVMGALGKQQKAQGLNAGTLTNLLGQERDSIAQAQPAAANLLGSLLDTDGDGDVDASDLAKHGRSILGKLFS